MKRASFLLLAITLTLVVACQPDENQNKNKNSNANANGNANGNANRGQNLGPMVPTDKLVQINVHDAKTAGYYDIEEPATVTLHTLMKQKAVFCVFYDGSTPPDEVVINGFRTISGPGATNPFGSGSPSDNDIHVPATDFNTCSTPPKAPKLGIVIPATYKYMITAIVGGADHGNRDPQVVIDN
jgi:hypothetical protein